MLEAKIAAQADKLLETVRKNGRTDIKWDSVGLQKALAKFYPLYQQTGALSVFAEIGPHPDSVSNEDRTPNTLILTPIFNSLAISEHFDFFSKEEEIRDQIAPNTITTREKYLFSPEQGWDTQESVEKTITGIKIYPL